MSKLDPVLLFRTLCHDIPSDLHGDVFVTGSLAAAYAFKIRLQGHAVNTKDADLLIHPAGNVGSAQRMAERLLLNGWRPTEQCKPLPELPDDPEKLWAIRLLPPLSNDYFIEFLNVPTAEQVPPKLWIPLKLNAGWFGLPSFKFMGLLTSFRRCSDEGLEYAAPEMMALSNLLSHPTVTDVEIESGEFRGLRRCAKDLGRVLALAHLAGRDQTETWTTQWRNALPRSFPRTWREHASRTGSGLREMLADDTVMEQARKTTDSGLLSGMGLPIPTLRAIGDRLLADAIEPFERSTDKP
jgi:hypothetical protein